MSDTKIEIDPFKNEPPASRSQPMFETVALEQLQTLQELADLQHLPTQITYQARMAVGGEGPRAGDWFDKPHRIVYDLCREIEASASLKARIEEMAAKIVDLSNFINEPPQYEELRMVRDYRHELWKRFEPLLNAALEAKHD